MTPRAVLPQAILRIVAGAFMVAVSLWAVSWFADEGARRAVFFALSVFVMLGAGMFLYGLWLLWLCVSKRARAKWQADNLREEYREYRKG